MPCLMDAPSPHPSYSDEDRIWVALGTELELSRQLAVTVLWMLRVGPCDPRGDAG